MCWKPSLLRTATRCCVLWTDMSVSTLQIALFPVLFFSRQSVCGIWSFKHTATLFAFLRLTAKNITLKYHTNCFHLRKKKRQQAVSHQTDLHMSIPVDKMETFSFSVALDCWPESFRYFVLFFSLYSTCFVPFFSASQTLQHERLYKRVAHHQRVCRASSNLNIAADIQAFPRAWTGCFFRFLSIFWAWRLSGLTEKLPTQSHHC